MTKRILTLAILCNLLIDGYAQSLVLSAWKFSTGDQSEWSSENFDHSKWQSISAQTSWEKQGFAGYDGYAWYRITFTVPSSMRKHAEQYGGLVLSLGKVDDVDFTYFNSELIGHTGKLPPDYLTRWDEPRKYIIPGRLIHWNQKNTIAVRVFDLSGEGGLFGGTPELNIRGMDELLSIAVPFAETDHIITNATECNIPVVFSNQLRQTYTGVLNLKVISDFGKTVYQSQKKVRIAKNTSARLDFSPAELKPGFYKAVIRVAGALGSKEQSVAFGVEPEKIISPTDAQPDFDRFWKQAKNELASIDPQFRLIKVDSLCTPAKNLFLIEMHSLGNALIRGWYSVPVAAGRYPAVMQVPGYSSVVLPSYINYGDDIIGLGLNIRGHGNSKDDVNPGFPGYLLNHLENRELYIYRGAYMDCARAIDFLFSRPEVDTTRVAVEGASQGGALTFATAALNSDRIKLCIPQVPFLSDFPVYFKIASWQGNEISGYVQNNKQLTWENVFNTLSYFDIKNLAPMIKAEMLMQAGLRDETCPPHINFAAYNQVTSPKSYRVFPEAGHGVPNEFYPIKMQWIRQQFGLSNP